MIYVKIPTITFLILLLATSIAAQPSPTPSDSPDLTVLEKSWRREVRHPALDADPFRANDEQRENERAQRDNGVRNATRVREGGTPLPTVSRRQPMETESPGPSTRYVYRVKLKNTSMKTIVALTWDYLFLHPDTQEELGAHSFTHRIKIGPGKGRELFGESSLPPTRVVDATMAGKSSSSQFIEELAIRRIEYADGSVWERQAN